MKIIIICAIFLLPFWACSHAGAQTVSDNYTPCRKYRPSKVLLKQITDEYIATAKSFEAKRSVKKQLDESIKNLSGYLTELDSEKLIMYTDTLSRYLNKIVRRIQDKNSLLNGKTYHVFVYRTTVPNAYNVGEGVILFNLDMISKMKNEAQIAYILCHELGHDIQGHVMEGIQKRIELYSNEEFQKELKNAMKQEYNSVKASEEVYKKFLTKYTEHSREHESAADSMGLILFANAGYSPIESVRQTLLEDSLDLPPFRETLDFSSVFNFKEYPFNKSWLDWDQSSTSLGSNIDSVYMRPDSLRTHPNCKTRANALRRIIKNRNLSENNVTSLEGNFSYFQTIARLEGVELLMKEREYGFALFTILQLLKKSPDNKYLLCAESNCLYEIYHAQLNHEFSRVMDFPDKKNPRSYNEFLMFFQNISGSSLQSIAVNYHKQYVTSIVGKDAFRGYVNVLFASMGKPKKEYPDMVKNYMKEYNDKFYETLLTEKLTPKPIKK